MLPARIKPGFWQDRLETNAEQAIFHQWDQLVASGCIENFKIAAGRAAGFREGWFFADSDAYKWLEAASKIWAYSPDLRLADLMDSFIDLLGHAQMPDGYLFTYNQIHFPGTRWQNLQIEHELYCHGHLVEAGVSHFEATGRTDLLTISRRAADRIWTDFQGKSGIFTPGHEEIEIALLRLHQVIEGDTAYLELARQLIEQRGRSHHFAFSLLSQVIRVDRRSKFVQKMRRRYLEAHPGFKPFQLPANNLSKEPPGIALRMVANGMSGRYFQQHAPVREQILPVGHAVRFAYLETATARLARESGDLTLLPALEQAWEHMVTRRLYLTGGLGSLPVIEGFGKDYELDPEYAYAETCAALGSLFWNWEMTQLTGQVKYSDLFEWQLYNAAAVGMGLDGKSYFYNNPLACRAGVVRQPWYAIPCCPSNLSRTWADLGKYLASGEPDGLKIHQYISSELEVKIPLRQGGLMDICVDMESHLPWQANVSLQINSISSSESSQLSPFAIHLRQPSWADEIRVTVNGKLFLKNALEEEEGSGTASGFDPRRSILHSIDRIWQPEDKLEIDFEMPIRLRHAHPKVKGHRGKIAVTRGPLVYCLESVDNPGIDLFSTRLDPESLISVWENNLLGGIIKITGKSIDGTPLIFIPYFLWGNRGPSQMSVWVNI
jgi:uncharacterized protein